MSAREKRGDDRSRRQPDVHAARVNRAPRRGERSIGVTMVRGRSRKTTHAMCGVVLAFGVVSGSIQGRAWASPHESYDTGIRVPDYGTNTRIVSIFQKPNKDLVVEFTFRTDDVLRVDFYDAREGRRLAQNEEIKAANDNAVLFSIFSRFSLTRIHVAGTLKLADGREVSSTSFTGRLCEGWPLDSFMWISRHDRSPEIRRSVILKLPANENKQYYCSVVQNKPFSLSYRYASDPLSFFSDRADGFYALVLDTPYLIHFDKNANSKFFVEHQDIMMVDTDALQGPFEQFKDGATSVQTALQRSAAVIDALGNRARSRGDTQP